MERERDQLEIQRQQLVSDRQKFMHEQIQLQGLRMKSVSIFKDFSTFLNLKLSRYLPL